VSCEALAIGLGLEQRGLTGMAPGLTMAPATADAASGFRRNEVDVTLALFAGEVPVAG